MNPPRVRANQLRIGYDGKPLVTDIRFELGRGQSLALVGKNGSGKSTLLKTIVGLLPPLGGEIEVVGTRPGDALRSIAYLSQFHSSAFILPLRAVDIVRMGRFPARGLLGRMDEEDRRLVNEAMRQMGIAALANTPLREMSGGQIQRTYLAQVLAHRADLIILDEPTVGLDAAGRKLYTQAICAELTRGATVITATHDIQEASTCNQIMLLARRVVGCGAPREVLNPEMLQETLGTVVALQGNHRGITIVEEEHGCGPSDAIERM